MRREAPPAPDATHSGRQPKTKARAVITIGRKRNRARGKSSLADALPGLVVGLGKLDDEDGVLGRQPNQHDQADRGKNVILKGANMQGQVCRPG